jgi:hypothetical protein
MNKVRPKEYIAFNCLICGMIKVFPSSHSDGNGCIECGGHLKPIGNAMVKNKCNNKGIDVAVNVDTTQLDEALEKARELVRLIDVINSPHKNIFRRA